MIERLESELKKWKSERLEGLKYAPEKSDINKLEKAIDRLYSMHSKIAIEEDKISRWVFPVSIPD